MSRVNKYLFSNFLTTFASLFATLFLILSIVFFIQIARITSYIEINFAELGKLYSYTIPQILLFTVPISFFVSVAMSFFRLSKENESIVIFTLGQNPKEIARFFTFASAILSLLLLINSLIIMPYVYSLNKNFIEYKKTKLNLNIKPSEFGQSFGDWMIFIGSKENESIFKDIVLYKFVKDDEKIITAKTGSLNNNNSNLELILQDGKIYDVREKYWNISDFKELVMRTFFQKNNVEEFSLSNYWGKISTDKSRAEHFSIYTLSALFPLASVLFAISFGIVTYRYEKGIVYFGIFGVLFLYFSLIMLFAKYHIYALLLVFLFTWFLSFMFYNKKISKKY